MNGNRKLVQINNKKNLLLYTLVGLTTLIPIGERIFFKNKFTITSSVKVGYEPYVYQSTAQSYICHLSPKVHLLSGQSSSDGIPSQYSLHVIYFIISIYLHPSKLNQLSYNADGAEFLGTRMRDLESPRVPYLECTAQWLQWLWLEQWGAAVDWSSLQALC